MKVGSLFTGALGLDWPWLGETHAWVSELDPDASAVLEARLPGVPNLGDVTQIDWATVDPVDVLIGGGFPCQPFSVAGKQKGATDDRYLWPEVVRAIRHLRPGLVVLENTPTVATRADGLPRFAEDLAAVGYDLRWTSFRAADIGAAHGRKRWLAIAHPCRRRVGPDTRPDRRRNERGGPGDGPEALSSRPEMAQPADPLADSRLFPTPQASDGSRGPDFARQRDRRESHGSGGGDLTTTVARLFPTPMASDAKGWTDAPATPETVGKARDAGGAGTLVDLPALLPTPVAADSRGARNLTAYRSKGQSSGGSTLGDVAYADLWGDYAPAVGRWAEVMGPPPAPAEDGKLAPRFVEWLMGFPAGWVTDILPRRPSLRVLGNAVVPHVAAVALDHLTNFGPR